MSMDELVDRDDPVFVISVAARMVGVRTQTLRYYEQLGLIQPSRTGGNQRVFSRRDVEKVRRIRGLMGDLGVNLAGVEVVLRLLSRLEETEDEKRLLSEENERLKRTLRRRSSA